MKAKLLKGVVGFRGISQDLLDQDKDRVRDQDQDENQDQDPGCHILGFFGAQSNGAFGLIFGTRLTRFFGTSLIGLSVFH